MGFLKTEADKSRKVGSPNEGFKTLHHKTTGNPILTIKKNSIFTQVEFAFKAITTVC